MLLVATFETLFYKIFISKLLLLEQHVFSNVYFKKPKFYVNKMAKSDTYSTRHLTPTGFVFNVINVKCYGVFTKSIKMTLDFVCKGNFVGSIFLKLKTLI